MKKGEIANGISFEVITKDPANNTERVESAVRETKTAIKKRRTETNKMFPSSDSSSRSKTVQVYLTGDVIGVRATRIPPFFDCHFASFVMLRAPRLDWRRLWGRREGETANTKANSIPTFERLCFSLKGTQLNFVSIYSNFVTVSASGKLSWLFVAKIIELNAQFKLVPRDLTVHQLTIV